jgi:hypothetical protein
MRYAASMDSDTIQRARQQLSQRLAQRLEELGLDLAAAAHQALGTYDTSSMRRYLAGTGLPTGTNLVALCEVLRVSPSWLLGADQWNVELADPSPPEAPPKAYADRLSQAAEQLVERTVPYAPRAGFRGVAGDELLLGQCPGASQPHRLINALYAHNEAHPAQCTEGDPFHLVRGSDGLVGFLESEDGERVTLGEARYLADAVRLLGGASSKKGRDPGFYAQAWTMLREAVEGALRDAVSREARDRSSG